MSWQEMDLQEFPLKTKCPTDMYVLYSLILKHNDWKRHKLKELSVS